jgi:hypothetical protein
MLLLVGGLFMDTRKLSELLLKSDDLKDIPAIYILRVAVSIIEFINSGECMKELDSCM